jgi:hypothetical protein
MIFSKLFTYYLVGICFKKTASKTFENCSLAIWPSLDGTRFAGSCQNTNQPIGQYFMENFAARKP